MNFRTALTILSTSLYLNMALASNDVARECLGTKAVLAQPPDDPYADPFPRSYWYINSNKSIWAGWSATDMKVGRNKVLWIRPKGSMLQIEAERLDGKGRFEALFSKGYESGFKASSLSFNEAGCWKITAKADAESLEFTTWVK